MVGDHEQDLNTDDERCNSEGITQSNEEDEKDEDETEKKTPRESKRQAIVRRADVRSSCYQKNSTQQLQLQEILAK